MLREGGGGPSVVSGSKRCLRRERAGDERLGSHSGKFVHMETDEFLIIMLAQSQ